MTDEKTLETCSVAPPEVTKLFSRLNRFGFPNDVLDVDEAVDLITKKIKRTQT
jgi:hypothetical protein